MSYHKGLPTNSDCLGYLARCKLANRCIEIIYHTTKTETIAVIDGKIWHKPFGHKPDGFSKINIK